MFRPANTVDPAGWHNRDVYKRQGYMLVDAVVLTKNVFTETIEMYDTDFQIQWGDGEEDYGYPIAALDDTMIPETYELGRAESKEYHCVYEVPEGSTDFSISVSYTHLDVYKRQVMDNSFIRCV